MDQMCCNDATFKPTCISLYYCQLAIGNGTGPFICPRPAGADPSKCKQDDASLKQQARYALQMCENQLQELYDLQRDLVECAHDVAMCKAEVDNESKQAENVAAEAQKCQAKAQGGGDTSGVEKIRGEVAQICKNPGVLGVHIENLAIAESACIAARIPKIEIPKISVDIEIPDVEVSGNIPISSPDFKVDVEMPDFSSPDIVVPGGGGKLDAPVSPNTKPLALDERKANVQTEKQKCEAAKSNCIPAKKQAAGTRTQMETKKVEACKASLMQVADGPKDVTISVLQALKSNMFFVQCAEVGVRVDALIAAIKAC
jgi:hypothetical protein